MIVKEIDSNCANIYTFVYNTTVVSDGYLINRMQYLNIRFYMRDIKRFSYIDLHARKIFKGFGSGYPSVVQKGPQSNRALPVGSLNSKLFANVLTSLSNQGEVVFMLIMRFASTSNHTNLVLRSFTYWPSASS